MTRQVKELLKKAYVGLKRFILLMEMNAGFKTARDFWEFTAWARCESSVFAKGIRWTGLIRFEIWMMRVFFLSNQ